MALPGPIERRLAALETALGRRFQRAPMIVVLEHGETSEAARVRLGISPLRPGEPPDIFVRIVPSPHHTDILLH